MPAVPLKISMPSLTKAPQQSTKKGKTINILGVHCYIIAEIWVYTWRFRLKEILLPCYRRGRDVHIGKENMVLYRKIRGDVGDKVGGEMDGGEKIVLYPCSNFLYWKRSWM